MKLTKAFIVEFIPDVQECTGFNLEVGNKSQIVTYFQETKSIDCLLLEGETFVFVVVFRLFFLISSKLPVCNYGDYTLSSEYRILLTLVLPFFWCSVHDLRTKN